MLSFIPESSNTDTLGRYVGLTTNPKRQYLMTWETHGVSF